MTGSGLRLNGSPQRRGLTGWQCLSAANETPERDNCITFEIGRAFAVAVRDRRLWEKPSRLGKAARTQRGAAITVAPSVISCVRYPTFRLCFVNGLFFSVRVRFFGKFPCAVYLCRCKVKLEYRDTARFINSLNRLRKCASKMSSMLSESSRTSARNCSLSKFQSLPPGSPDINFARRPVSAGHLIGAQCRNWAPCRSACDALLPVPKPRT